MARYKSFVNRALLWALILTGVMALQACYPTYNWRTLSLADGAVELAFPARVDTATRQVDLAGVKVKFSLTSAEARDTLFSMGYATLPDSGTAMQTKAVQKALVDSLAASMGQSAPETAYAGDVFRIESDARGKPLAMVARVLIHRNLAIRVVASGPPELLTDAVAQEFMRSLKLR